ncbi:MAG: hypothetical protein ACYC5X_11780 [Syntrophales bacterium]
MDKNMVKIVTLLSSLVILSACGGSSSVSPNDKKVNLITGYSDITTYETLANYSKFSALVEAEETFVIIITNMSRSSTTVFLPILNQYIQEEGIKVYLLESTLIYPKAEHYGLPIRTADTPIIGIYENGVLAYHKAYVTGEAEQNKPFTSFDAFKAWLEDKIILPTFIYITKAELDAKFAGTGKFIIYYGRTTCPDCTYLIATFLKSYITAHPSMKKIYALDVQTVGLYDPNNRTSPTWEAFKANYGMSNVINTALGYSTGFVPTFQYIEANGSLPENDMSVIKDMAVVYNDAYKTDDATSPYQITRSYYDGTRPLGYTNINILGKNLTAPAKGTTDMHPSWAAYHEPLIAAFFDIYVPSIN